MAKHGTVTVPKDQIERIGVGEFYTFERDGLRFLDVPYGEVLPDGSVRFDLDKAAFVLNESKDLMGPTVEGEWGIWPKSKDGEK